VTVQDMPIVNPMHATPRHLPVVKYEDQRWFFDARLRELRNVAKPHLHRELDDFEMRYFSDLVDGSTSTVPTTTP